MLTILNLFVCSLGGYVCVCRMAKMSESETKLMIRTQYVIWFCAFTVSGWSFAFFDEVNVVQLLLGVSIVAQLLLGAGAWRHNAPHYTRRLA